MADDNADQGSTTEEAVGASTPSPDTPISDVDSAKPAKKAAAKKTTKRAPAKRAPAKKAAVAPEDDAGIAGDVTDAAAESTETTIPAKKAPAKRAPAKKAAAKKAPAKKAAAPDHGADDTTDAPQASETPAGATAPAAPMPLFQTPDSTPAPRTRRAPAKKAAAPVVDEPLPGADDDDQAQTPVDGDAGAVPAKKTARKRTSPAARAKAAAEDQSQDDAQDESEDESTSEPAPRQRRSRSRSAPRDDDANTDEKSDGDDDSSTDSNADGDDDSDDESGDGGPRRRRRRGGRRRRKSGDGGGQGDGSADSQQGGQNGGQQGGQRNQNAQQGSGSDGADNDDNSQTDDDAESGDGTSRRRRRRRREGDDGGTSGGNGSGTSGGNGGGNGGGNAGDPNNTTTRVRRARSPEDEITAISGSTRLEAKKQRRRDGREAGRRRAPIVSEAEFLARRESVERVMTIRQREDVIQIGVLEDKVLVEHYVARESQTSLIGNVYLGRVQNVLPSMEAAFIDIGKGRNAVLYAGEVNWSALGHKDGGPRKIESVLSSGQTILVQVTKDPLGHKGARLTSQVSLAGRFLVYVPDGTTSGISRKLPDTERHRLKTLLKEIVPESAGVIVRTAAEGATEEELTQDVERLKSRWEDIEAKSGGKAKGGAPQLLYGEPDLTLKVVRDLFTEDFAKLVIAGDEAWETVSGYVADIAPDLEPRLEKYVPAEHNGVDLFAAYRVDEQIAKALDRKVFLPSGGSLVIDRTEAMTVVDVNTGKFTGSGGNLEETVTKNNLEAAEEVVRQLRLRDIGGIIVVDFIDMVLESNRDLVLRRMVECLGRDRTRHQVAEVTSLGLIQMTRKRIGTGLLESFSENCQHCQGRGVVVHDMPVEPRQGADDEPRRGGGGGSSSGGGGGRRRGGRGRSQDDEQSQSTQHAGESTGSASKPSPAEFAAMAKAERAREDHAAASETDQPAAAPVESADEPEQPIQPTSEPAAPRVVTRTRRGGASRTSAVTTSTEPAEESADEPAAEAAQPVAPVEPVTPPSEPAPPRVVTRTRRGGASRTAPVSTSTDSAEPAEQSAPDAIEPASEKAPEPEAIAEPVTPAEPSAPRVVTRTRRGVSRTVATPAAEPVETPAPTAAPVAPAVAENTPEKAPEPPRVVTRTRGQAATRRTTAGAAAEVPGMDEVAAISGIGSPPESGIVEPVAADLEPGGDVPPEAGTDVGTEAGTDIGTDVGTGDDADTGAAHVPVKRKRTRKH